MSDLDLFAGPGGWDVGARSLGLDPLGLEWDDAACATRAAAGLRTLQGDVSALDPATFAPCTRLIASPPCPTFSTAGDQRGSLVLDLILNCGRRIMSGEDAREETRGAIRAALLPTAKTPERAERDAAMTMLVVEPLRWTYTLRPEVVAMEQVPPVLALWSLFGGLLEQLGYKTWCGILNAADYGVPQTRRRAILIASRVGRALPPEPTHCKGGSVSLDGELAPWVSMAEALGWGMTERPSVPIMARAGDGGIDPLDGGAGTRAAIERSKTDGLWLNPGQTDTQPNRRTYSLDEPAPSIAFGHDAAGWSCQDHPASVLRTNRGQDENGDRQKVDGGRRAPAVTGKAGGQWYWGSPATTIAGDPRITARTHHEHGEQGRDATSSEDARNGNYDGRSAIRITIEEAATLQGFPPEYPWQGSRTKQFEQIGNAVPPPLARAILEALGP